MKKLLALVLALASITALMCACNKKEENSTETTEAEEKIVWMPFDLEFGMSYDEAKEVNADMPDLKDADANDGYFCGTQKGDSTVCDLVGLTETPILAPQLSYSFNENKELYEYYFIVTYYDEGDAENAFNDCIDYYTELLGADPTETVEDDDMLGARWDNDIQVDIMLQVNDYDGFYLFVILHDTAHELTD